MVHFGTACEASLLKQVQLTMPKGISEVKPVDYEFNILVCHLLVGNFEYLFVSMKNVSL